MSRIFGQIAQIGYVVTDIEASMQQWIRHGVGPWFYIERVQTDYFRHRGVDSPVQLSIALANSGDVQIELIQQRNDAPSMYREFLDSGRSGAQHVAYWTTDFARPLPARAGGRLHRGSRRPDRWRARQIRLPRHRARSGDGHRDLRYQRRQGPDVRLYPRASGQPGTAPIRSAASADTERKASK